MKKKILSLIAVTAALSTAGCALVACGGGDDGDGKVKTEVTKDQWAAALSVESFTSNFKVVEKNTRTYDKDEKYERQTTFAVGPQKFGNYTVSLLRFDEEGKEKEEQEIIAIIGSEKDTGYSRKNKFDSEGKRVEGEWLVDEDAHREMNNTTWAHMLENLEFDTYVFAFADKYDSFKYESGKYVIDGSSLVLYEETDEEYSSTTKVTASEATITFANGKVASIEVKAKDESTYTWNDETETNTNNEECSYIFTYGGQKITAPKVEKKIISLCF